MSRGWIQERESSMVVGFDRVLYFVVVVYWVRCDALEIRLYKDNTMSGLFDVVANQFQSNTQYEKFIKESQKEYDVKIYRLSNFTQTQAKAIHSELQAKYEDKTLSALPSGWYENERRLYVWFIICFIHYKGIDPVKFIDGCEKYWRNISEAFWGKEVYFLKYQLLNIFKIKGRTIWKAEEDQFLLKAFKMHQFGEWNEIAKTFYHQSSEKYFKTPKQCRERWQNHLNVQVKKGEWTLEEDLVIFREVSDKGTKWAYIAGQLNRTRTEHMIKNRYKSLVGKIVNERKVEEKEAVTIILEQIVQRLEGGNKEKRAKRSLQDEVGSIEKVESEIMEESEIIEPEEQVSKKSMGKSKKITKKQKQSISNYNNKGSNLFNANRSVNEGNMGSMNQQSQLFKINLLDEPDLKFTHLFRFELDQQSNIFKNFNLNNFSRYEDKNDGESLRKSQRPEKKEENPSIFFESSRSKKSNNSIRNNSMVGQYLS